MEQHKLISEELRNSIITITDHCRHSDCSTCQFFKKQKELKDLDICPSEDKWATPQERCILSKEPPSLWANHIKIKAAYYM